ncbi:MAG TPA: hypothetical protein VE868_04820 [Balneolaceae bacterium]|nr:hypothetical protein [Balneolaceae bacterium]
MDNQEQSQTAQQRLDIIHEMIARAKGKISKDSSFYFLLWGWVVLISSIVHFLLLQYTTIHHPEWAWSIILVGIFGSFVKGYKERKSHKANTYLNRLYGIIWITFMVSYLILLVFSARINFYIAPLVLLMAASATYLSGALIKFNPLKWGAVFIWVMGIVAFLVALPYQLLATAAAVLIGYLIPGYMLKQSEA